MTFRRTLTLLLRTTIGASTSISCTNFELALWDVYDDDEDNRPIPAAIWTCCERQSDAGEQRRRCVQDAVRGIGECAPVNPRDAAIAAPRQHPPCLD